MTLIRPRLNDFHKIPLAQEYTDFAVPFLDEDIPLYIDPFLLWKSPSQQDNSLHTALINAFNSIGNLYLKGKTDEAIQILISLSECDEVGFGDSKKRIGKKIGSKLAVEILDLYNNIPQIKNSGFIHFEEIQLLVDNFSKDRVSDITCSILKSFLIDYTIDQCTTLNIPLEKTSITIFDYKKLQIKSESSLLPINPINKSPLIFVPKRWLRFIPWINYEDYFKNHYIKDIDKTDYLYDRIKILNFNRDNYDLLKLYLETKERNISNCKNDPLFEQIPILSAKRKLKTILKLPTGKTNNADQEYEDNLCQVLTSLLYPHLDFAKEQSRTISNVLIRDLIFYNNTSERFLKEIYEKYECYQMVIEIKNVLALNNDHIDQLNRYLKDQFGRFGIIFTRNKPLAKVFKNTIDLWSGQRKCIIILDDEDLKDMVQLYEGKQRNPIDVINKKYVEFTRACPS